MPLERFASRQREPRGGAVLARRARSAKAGGDFYAGVLQTLSMPAHVLSFIAIGLLAGQQGGSGHAAPIVFCTTLILGATGALWLPLPQALAMFNLVCTAVLGGWVAASWPLPAAVLQAMAAALGLSHGIASGAVIGTGLNPWLFVPGIGLVGLAVSTYGLIAADYLLRRNIGWMRIAVRVAGSWIAAIAIRVLASSTAVPVGT